MEKDPRPRRILIVKLSALGDVLRTTSLLRPLAGRWPGARIAWATSKEALPLLETNPWVSELWAAGSPGWARGAYDLVLSLEEDAGVARRAAKACRGILHGVTAGERGLSYTRSSASYYDMSLLNRSPDGSLDRANSLKSANRLTYAGLWLRILGLPVPKDRDELRPVLVLSREDRAFAAEFFRRAGLDGGPLPIGLNTGAGRRWPSKQLGAEGTVRLARALHRRCRRPLVLFGGRDEAARNAAIVRRCRAAGVPLLDPGTGHSLRTFAGLVERCEAVVTTDTLALHVATALARKTFVLVGPTSAAELDVFGRGAKLVPDRPCSCFYRPRCLARRSCLDRIPSGRVAEAVGRTLR